DNLGRRVPGGTNTLPNACLQAGHKIAIWTLIPLLLLGEPGGGLVVWRVDSRANAPRYDFGVSPNIQAPYPTTRSRKPAASPELHKASRRAFKPRRPASISSPATATQPHASFGPRLAHSPFSIAAAVAASRRCAVS